MLDDKQFIKDSLRTESNNFNIDGVDPRVLHAAIGLSTEVGELLDPIKKTIFYNKPLDVTNIKEESGDLLWYLAILYDAIGTDFETESARVINKLKARFPEKYTDECASDRDLELERDILEVEL